ncbi:MAG: TetR family transcriptional regulator [Pseudonocardiaceae bacterium]|nr:TetR family transcriptional regulator [Pseudonocardiaceae bacterium]
MCCATAGSTGRCGIGKQQASGCAVATEARLPRRHSEGGTRQEILDAAARVFRRLGYARTTIADLAGEAAVSRPTIYAYFGSKHEVFRALAQRVGQEFLALQERADVSTPEKTLRTTLVAYLDTYVRHLGVLTVIAHQALSDPEMRRLRAEIHDRPNRRHTRFIERLVAQGVADPAVPPAVVSEVITGVVMRFAEEAAASPERRHELGEQLIVAHRRLTGMPGGMGKSRPREEETADAVR